MVSSEGLNDIVEDPVSEWVDDTYFGEDDDLEDEFNFKTNVDLTSGSHSSRPGTNKSTFSQLRGDSKRVRLKYPYPPVFTFINNNLKRDPTVEYIIESRKSNIIENIYTHLAETTSHAFRPSQYNRIKSLKPRHTPTKTETQVHVNDTKEEPINSSNGRKLQLLSAFEFDSDELNNDFDKEDLRSKNKSNLQVYEETCKRLNISICSIIVRSLHTTKINLENYGLGIKGSAALAAALVRNTTVLSLNLSGNNIGSSGMSHIYQILTENTYIEDYDLSYNNLGTEGIRKLAAATISCVQLKRLNISGNELTSSDINILLTKLEDHPKLRDLNLSHNQLDEEGGILLAKWICDNNVLLNLDVSWCSIRLMGARALAKAIGENNKLVSLDLSNNSFTNDTIGYLTNSLTRNMVLNDLNLSENQFFCRYNTRIKENPAILITGRECLVYKMFVAAMTNQVLKIFRLGKNHLDARCVMIMLEALSKLDNISLEELHLPGLTLTTKQISDIQKLFAKHHLFKCNVESIRKTVEQFANNLLNSIHTYCLNNQTNLTDIFTLNEGNVMSITYDQFLNGLRKVHIPFPVTQIEDIMKYLGRGNDQRTILLKSLEI